MFLSNPRNPFLLALFFATLFQACSSSGANTNKLISLTAETKSEFPFSTIEPDVYKGEVVVTTGQLEKKWFVARRADQWRLDVVGANGPVISQLKTDRLYQIDHRKKLYAADDAAESDPAPINELTANIFRGKEYRDFDDLGRDGALRKYKIRETESSKGDILIYVDEASGIIVRQEFFEGKADDNQVSYVYEIRNLKLDVDGSVFAIPAGYRKVSWDEYRASKP